MPKYPEKEKLKTPILETQKFDKHQKKKSNNKPKTPAYQNLRRRNIYCTKFMGKYTFTIFGKIKG